MVKDNELKETASGQKVSSFTVATNHEWKDASWEKKSITEYHNCIAWGKLAEICNHLKKGRQVFVEWRIQTKMWEKDGVKHYNKELVADSLIMLGGSPWKAIDVSDEFADLKPKKNEINLEDIQW